jgi:hypothetical protein
MFCGLNFVLLLTDALAETKRECRRYIMGTSAKLQIEPTSEAYSKALRYCMAGDKQSVVDILQADTKAKPKGQVSKQECRRKLSEMSKRSGAKPSEVAYKRALRYCMAGDMRRASLALQSDSESGAGKQVSKKECVDRLKKLAYSDKRYAPSKKAFKKAKNRCEAGDYRNAVEVLKADSAPGSKTKVAERWCRQYLREMSDRVGTKPKNKSFEKAMAQCRKRNFEEADALILSR